MSTTIALGQIFNKLTGTTKWQLDFFIEIFNLIYSIQGRFNFQNLTRYSDLNESTFRRNFQKFFDWLDFNYQLILLSGVDMQGETIAALDCSYIPKAGSKTFGIDRFWSGCANRAIKGLELSLVCLIDVKKKKAWALDAAQTPSKLSEKENDSSKTRIDFYMDQLLKCMDKLLTVSHFVADGYYAKTKVFQFVRKQNKHLITKLRINANLRYLFEGKQKQGRGRPREYGEKIDLNDIRKWTYEGDLEDDIEVYSIIANSPKFSMNLKVVMLYNTKTHKHVLLGSTDLKLSSFKIIEYYRLRFKIEFLFRDAKQFTGLTHCQARSEEKINFHFNLSLAAINMAYFQMDNNPTIMSMNTFKRLAYNTRFVEHLFKQLSLKAKVDINSSDVQNAIQLGRMWAAVA
ncbi:MAG: hypothetical protein ACJATF_004142 [Flavobacteriales bacterium]|jgi:hypothetical protein